MQEKRRKVKRKRTHIFPTRGAMLYVFAPTVIGFEQSIVCDVAAPMRTRRNARERWGRMRGLIDDE